MRKFNILWLLPIACVLTIGSALIWGKRTPDVVKLHPVKDTVTFDTLHSRIPDIKTGD